MPLFRQDPHKSKPKLGLIFLTSAILALAGCSGGGETGEEGGPINDANDGSGAPGGGNDPIGGDPNDPGSAGGGSGSVTPTVSFNLSGAVSLVANEDAIVEDTQTNSLTRGGKKLFTYSLASASSKVSARGFTRNEDGENSSEENQGVSNLLAINENGDAQLAVDTNMPMKVMYSVGSPDGTKVYIALDTGWDNHSGSESFDYAGTIAALNCGLLEVDTATNQHSCVEEGLFVQKMDDEYQKAVSGNQKPIQFDEDGNMYFAATTFTRQENSWCNFHNENGECEEEYTSYWLDHVSWDPRIYKMDMSTGDVSAVTQDNEVVTFFLVLPSGELAYQAWQTEGNYSSTLYIMQGNSKINLTDGTGWIEFFTVDTGNTVIFGDGSWGQGADGLKLARPTAGGGIFKSSLNTSLFGDNNNGSWSNPTPRRIILADDGRVYGVFEGGRNEQDPNDSNNWLWIPTLKVYQVLPYDGVPKVELDLDPNSNWWDIFFAGTPFQIAKGFLYYTRAINVEFGGASYGDADIIEMVKLETREKQTLLQPASATDPRYEMYNWQLSGTELFFSGLDKSNNTVVTGTIDTLKVRDGEAQSEFLEIKESASAVGAASKVQDIEVIGAAQPNQDSGGTPKVDEIHADQDNLYSVSIDFTKHMDKDTVESNLALVDGSNAEAYTMKVWLHKTLHLIVDRDSLSDDTVSPMLAATNYTLDFEAGTGTMRDAFGVDLSLTDLDVNAGNIATSFTTRPSNGWYIGSTTDSSSLTSGDVLKFAGPATDWEMETFLLRDLDATANVRVEFSAKNLGWDGPQIMLWDNDATFTCCDDWWTRTIVKLRMSGWSDLNYKTTFSDDNSDGTIDNWMDEWDNGNTENLFNGQWKRYRVDIYDTKLRVSVSEDGTTYTEVSMFSKDDLAARNGGDYHLLMRVNSAMIVDDLKVQNLDVNGVVGADIFAETFDGDSTIPNASPTDFGTDVNDSAPYNLDNW